MLSTTALRSVTAVSYTHLGTVAFLADEGEKVAKGQAVAQFFTDENQLALYRQSQALGEEIESVKYAFTHMTDGSDGVKLDSLIKMNMLQLGAKLQQGLVSQAEEYSSKLDAMIVQRGVAQKGDTDYAAILQELESQKACLLYTSRAVPAGKPGERREKLQCGCEEAGGRYHLLAEDRPRRGRRQLRHPGG